MILDLNNNTYTNEKDIDEKELQHIFECKLDLLVGLRFLISEFSIVHGSDRFRIDTLAMDRNNNLVVIEYKQDKSSTIINQGIQYVDAILENRDYVRKSVALITNNSINWSRVRLICVAKRFSPIDLSMSKKFNVPINLVKYTYYEDHRILLDTFGHNFREIEYHASNTLVSTDMLDMFLKDLGQFATNVGNGTNYGFLFGRGLCVMTHTPSYSGSGMYGGQGHKKPACVFGQDVVLIKLDKVIKSLSRYTNKTYGGLEPLIDIEFKKTIENQHGLNNLVLAPKQYQNQWGMYTAFNKEELIKRYPLFAEIRWK